MPNKKVILAAVAAALLFGVTVSGCNRHRETRTAGLDKRQRQAKSRHDIETGSTHRPAEVLSASVRRAPPARQSSEYQYSQPSQYSYYADASRPNQYYEPLPEPIPVEQLPQYRQQTAYYGQQSTSTGAYYADAGQYYAQYQPYSAPAYQSVQGSYSGPIEVIYPTADYAVANAHPAVAAPTYAQPAQTYAAPIVQRQPSAPIPELEPVRYRRVAHNWQPIVEPPSPLPALPPSGQYSASFQPNDVRRALAPLAQTGASAGQDWVSSPTTAMRAGYR